MPWYLIGVLTACGLVESEDRDLWQRQGLEGRWITALAETPWGPWPLNQETAQIRL